LAFKEAKKGAKRANEKADFVFFGSLRPFGGEEAKGITFGIIAI
jgi:hypothetical protein